MSSTDQDLKPLIALVVDDVATNRKLLSAILKRHGLQIIEAENGQEAVDIVKSSAVDVIFMDIMMPVMDGYEATRQIKALDTEDFVPIIMVTALDERQGLEKGIEAGADDYLTKPIDAFMIAAKLKAMSRIRALYSRVMTQKIELQEVQQQITAEQIFAENIFQNVIKLNSQTIPGVTASLEPADIFSGDLIMQSQADDGSWLLMVCDFTGHGLPGAIGAIPVSEAFFVMNQKGFKPLQILKEINFKLLRFLPSNMFMGCLMFSYDKNAGELSVFNGGMPRALVKDGRTGKIKTEIASHDLPLGIVEPDGGEFKVTKIDVREGDCIVAYSDGLTEAEDDRGEQFGVERLINVIENAACENLNQVIIDKWREYHSQEKQKDDVTLVTLSFKP